MSVRLKEQGKANTMRLYTDNAGRAYLDWNGHRTYMVSTAVTAGVTSTTLSGVTAPAGSHLKTSNAQGLGIIFIAQGGLWVAMSDATYSFTPAAAVTPNTDNSGGTPSVSDTLVDQNNAVTGVDGTGSNAASKADVDARLVTIAHNVATLNAKINDVIASLQAADLMAE